MANPDEPPDPPSVDATPRPEMFTPGNTFQDRYLAFPFFRADFWRTLRIEVLPWIPLIISLIAISLSLYTFFSVRTTPDMLVILPSQVRIVQGGVQPAWIYLEPTFLHTGTSERVEAVVELSLSIEAADRPDEFVDFFWDESGTWQYEAVTRELNWHFTDDPGPFLVSPRNAAQFTGLFQAPPGWRFQPGLYRVTLHVTRLHNQEPMAVYADVELSSDAIEYLDEFSGSRFLAFPLTSTYTTRNSSISQ